MSKKWTFDNIPDLDGSRERVAAHGLCERGQLARLPGAGPGSGSEHSHGAWRQPLAVGPPASDGEA